jgi:NTE family protein
MMSAVRLALSGSGFLAPIHAGAVCAFMDAGVTIIEVAGTSGGSIVAAMVAAGMNQTQIKARALAPVPSGVMRYQPFAIMRKAMNNGSVLQDWLDSAIGECTLGAARVPITIMATDIAGGTGAEFSDKQTPHIRLADACRASAAVPFVYSPKNLYGRDYVDGGMVCNIPTDKLIDDDVPRVGIHVDGGSSRGDASTLIGFIKQCIGTLLAANENNLVAWAAETGASIIPVKATPYGFLDPNLPRTAKEDLFNRGYEAVTAFLKANDLPPLCKP